jgi:chromosome condensin MukBEF complex kleisin-like MukF subunit
MSRLCCLDKFKSDFSMDVVITRLCPLGIEYLDLYIQKLAHAQVRPFNASRTKL